MIRLKDVVKEYPNGTHALNGLSLEIQDGEFVFMVGPSGSGKSTVIRLLVGEVEPSEGQVMVNGFSLLNIRERQIPYLRRTVGVIFQDFRLIEHKTVYDNMVFAMRAVGASGKEIKKRIPYCLDLVGLADKGKRLPSELSGGEQQRVAIARALLNNPNTIIADEPTGNLDPARSLEIMRLLERINALGTTVLVVTHEKDLVNRFDKRVVMLENGRVVSDGKGYRLRVRRSKTAAAPAPVSQAETQPTVQPVLQTEVPAAPEPKPENDLTAVDVSDILAEFGAGRASQAGGEKEGQEHA